MPFKGISHSIDAIIIHNGVRIIHQA